MAHTLRADEFDALLRQLGPDPERAGVCYVRLRERLVCILGYRGCSNPEELADETLDRVARRVAEHPADFDGDDPTRFVLGVAWNVARESFRRRRTVPLPVDWDAPDPAERPDSEEGEADEQECLEHCLETMPVKHRELLLQYFAEEKRARITGRSQLASQLALTPNALRLKVHRLAIGLRKCVVESLEARRGRGHGPALGAACQ